MVYVELLTNEAFYFFGKERGAGGGHTRFSMAKGSMNSHISQFPVGTYKKGHRHGPDFHVFAVTGQGYSLLWYEGDSKFVEVPWRHGGMYTPPFWMYQFCLPRGSPSIFGCTHSPPRSVHPTSLPATIRRVKRAICPRIR